MKNNLTPQESLQIISEMIEARRAKIGNNGFMIRFWGWLVIAASIGQVTLMQFELYDICWTPWLLMIFGGIFSVCKSMGRKDKSVQKSHLDQISSTIWLLFGLNAMILGFVFLPLLLWSSYIGILLIVLGICSIVEGVISNFKASVVGGIVTNVLGFVALLAAVFVTGDNEWLWQFVILIGGIIASNLVPGYILKGQYNHE